MSEWITSSTPYPTPRLTAAQDPWKEEAERAGHVGAHRLTLVEKQIPSDRVCRLLGTEPRTPAILRRRIVTLDDRPAEVADSWYPARIAERTPPSPKAARFAVAHYGHSPSSATPQSGTSRKSP